jgi:hypothetical protein
LLHSPHCGRIETGNVGVRTDFNKQVELIEMNPGFYTAHSSRPWTSIR